MSTQPLPSRPAAFAGGILTFLIADIRGYTSFTRSRGDEAAARLAATFAEIVREGVEARDGEVIELRGDEALAVFPSARQALRAAVELQQTFGDEVARRPGVPLLVGIGLDAGEAVPVETGYRGAALNLAARLCSQAGAGEVLASQGVTHLAGAVHGLRFVERGDVNLKGIDRPVAAMVVLPEERDDGVVAPVAGVPGDNSVPGELPPELDPLTPIVGRDREARWLRWTWRRARRRPGQAVFVSGAVGVGKTRLLAEPAALAASDGAPTSYVRCSERNDVAAALVRLADARDPMLLVLDDLDAADSADLHALSEAIDGLAARCLLLIAAYRDGETPEAVLQLVRRAVDRGAALHRALGPLDESAVRELAALYVEDPSRQLPARAMLEASDGLPGRLHELAAEWVRGETARRVGENVSLAAAGRSSLRRIEAELASNVIDLQRARDRASLYARDGASSTADMDASPFKGLASFDVGDARFFFGRERLIAELIGRLAGAAFLGVVGPSGSGKSSAIRAGLVPALEAGVLPGSEQWTRVLLRPGERPLRELDRALYAALPEALRPRLKTDDDPLRAAAGGLSDDGRLLVVIDQFEEVFTACRDAEERARFIGSIASAALDARVVVIVAIRADFYGRCASHPELAELLAAHHVLVGPMTADEYRRAIEQPAARAGVRIEPALVDALVTEVVDEPGGLPLLSTALLELWQRRDGRVIRADAYAATGGVRGAVARLAEEAYGRLSVDAQAVARSVLLRLSAGEGETAVRRRVPLTEFDASTNADVQRVLDVLTDARLLTIGEGTVEIAHEALLREWPRLVTWLEEDREGRRLRSHLTEASKEWAATGRESGELYRGARLASALDWTTVHTFELNELEREFVNESRAANEREADRQRRTNRRLRLLLGGVGVLFAVSLAAGAVAVLQSRQAEQEAAVAREQRALAEGAATAADAQRLGAQALVQKDLDLALLLARQGAELHDSAATNGNLLAALVRSPQAIRIWRPLPGRLLRVAVNPAGDRLVVVNNGATVALVDASTGEVVEQFAGDDAFFAADGSVVLVQYRGDGMPPALEVFDPATGEQTATVQLLDGLAGSVAPDLTTISVIAPDGSSLSIHDTETGAPVAELRPPDGMSFVDVYQFASGHLLTLLRDGALPADFAQLLAGPITYAWWQPGRDEPTSLMRTEGDEAKPFAVAPDLGTMALAHRDGAITLFELATGRARDVHGRHNAAVTGVAFSPDSRTLVSGGDDRVALVWDTASGELRETLSGHNGRVFAPAIAALDDEVTAYTVSLDGSVMAWDVSGGRRLGRPFSAGATLTMEFENDPSLAISPDGALLAIAETDGTVRVLDVESLRTLEELPAVIGAPVLDVAFSPDGRHLAVAGVREQIVRLWDVATWTPGERLPGPPIELDGEPLFARSIAFSPDGRFLAAGVGGGQIWLWDAATSEPLGEPITVSEGGILDVAFGPASDVIAAAIANVDPPVGIARTWRLDDRSELYSVDVDGGYGRASAVAFSPDGRLLVTGGGTGDARFWDAATGARAGPSVQASAGWLHTLQFDRAGTSLVTGGGDGTVRLYDPAKRAQIGAPLPGPDNQPPAAVFSPDGSRVFAIYANGRGFAWDISIDTWKSHACRVAGRALTEAEWQQFLPGRPYAPACRTE